MTLELKYESAPIILSPNPFSLKDFSSDVQSVQLVDTFLIVNEGTLYEYNAITGNFDVKHTFSVNRYSGRAIGVYESELNCT